jgi:DNA-binding MarR family transcriptional regulator
MTEFENSENLTPWICQISRLSNLFVGREMSRLGFGTGQFYFLAELYNEEGLSQDELSRRVGVDKSNTSRALAKLERYGLIRRECDAENHRVKKIYLEAKAHDIKDKFYKIQNQWNNELLNGIAENLKTRLLETLKEMAHNAGAYLDQKRRQ